MVALVLVLCLLADPVVCKEESPFEEVTSIQCQMNGQAAASVYMQDYPKWALRGWKCQTGKQDVPA